MKTKVFISWSGELSKKLGEALHSWLPAAFQNIDPYFTPDDIEKGRKWDTDIAEELEGSNIGLFCLTKDNTEAGWLLFEAGALSKSVEKSHVCPILFNLDTTDLKGPLTGFQATRFVEEDFKRLVETINGTVGDDSLDQDVLTTVFDKWWPDLHASVLEILASHTEEEPVEERSQRDLLEEVLELTRMNTVPSAMDDNRALSERILSKIHDLEAALLAFTQSVPRTFNDATTLIRRGLGPQTKDIGRRVTKEESTQQRLRDLNEQIQVTEKMLDAVEQKPDSKENQTRIQALKRQLEELMMRSQWPDRENGKSIG